MVSLVSLYLLAMPFCAGTIDEQKCARWMADDIILEMYHNPGQDMDYYLEYSSERIPEEFWRVDE